MSWRSIIHPTLLLPSIGRVARVRRKLNSFIVERQKKPFAFNFCSLFFNIKRLGNFYFNNIWQPCIIFDFLLGSWVRTAGGIEGWDRFVLQSSYLRASGWSDEQETQVYKDLSAAFFLQRNTFAILFRHFSCQVRALKEFPHPEIA